MSMSKTAMCENTYRDTEPGTLARLLGDNWERQRVLTQQIEELEEDACALREALAPAVPLFSPVRLLVGPSYRPKLMILHRLAGRVDGLEVTVQLLVHPDSLKFPEPPTISIVEAPEASPEAALAAGLSRGESESWLRQPQ